MMKNVLLLFCLILVIPVKAQQVYLVTPSDGSNVQMGTVNFQWLQVLNSKPVLYDFKLREIVGGQSEIQALGNIALVTSSGINTTYTSVSFNEEGKSYIWTVQAYYMETEYLLEDQQPVRVNITPISHAVFHIPSEEEAEEEEWTDPYINLKKGALPSYSHFISDVQDTIYAMYYESYGVDSVEIQIYDYNNEGYSGMNDSLVEAFDDSVSYNLLLHPNYKHSVGIGYNFLKIPKEDIEGDYDSDKIYYLILRNKMGDLYRARIEFE